MTQNQLQKKIGMRIREIREGKGITQQELATSIKKLRPVVQRIEGGLVNPSIFTIREIAGGLKVTLEELLKGLK
jgi:transcriptional regulator with XRE-family HTH domain